MLFTVMTVIIVHMTNRVEASFFRAEDEGSSFLQNVDPHLPDYLMSHV
jgi:hypothetical protein